MLPDTTNCYWKIQGAIYPLAYELPVFTSSYAFKINKPHIYTQKKTLTNYLLERKIRIALELELQRFLRVFLVRVRFQISISNSATRLLCTAGNWCNLILQLYTYKDNMVRKEKQNY